MARFKCPGCGEKLTYLLEHLSVVKIFKVFPSPNIQPSYVEDVDCEPIDYECPKCGHRELLIRDFMDRKHAGASSD
ncbi:MAG: hypothetical protein QXK69_08215 [Candidatus Caldarchaeum sp.]